MKAKTTFLKKSEQGWATQPATSGKKRRGDAPKKKGGPGLTAAANYRKGKSNGGDSDYKQGTPKRGLVRKRV